MKTIKKTFIRLLSRWADVMKFVSWLVTLVSLCCCATQVNCLLEDFARNVLYSNHKQDQTAARHLELHFFLYHGAFIQYEEEGSSPLN